jgi:hypothetical protein
MRWANMGNAYKISVRKPEWKTTLRHIKMNVKEIWCRVIDWVYVTQLLYNPLWLLWILCPVMWDLMNTVMNL